MSTLNINVHGPDPQARAVARRFPWLAIVLAMLSSFVVGPSLAIDLEKFTGITGPLTSALTQLSTLTPGLKGIIGFISF